MDVPTLPPRDALTGRGMRFAAQLGQLPNKAPTISDALIATESAIDRLTKTRAALGTLRGRLWGSWPGEPERCEEEVPEGSADQLQVRLRQVLALSEDVAREVTMIDERL